MLFHPLHRRMRKTLYGFSRPFPGFRFPVILLFRPPICLNVIRKVSKPMIAVTRLNGNPMLMNSDLIKTAEASPDTMLTLINGEKLIVRETCADVMERVIAYRARLLTDVARKLQAQGAFERTAGIASLDLEKQCDPFADTESKRPLRER
jgi:flagellar protein FlbD